MSSVLNISLQPHVIEILKKVVNLVPPDIHSSLEKYTRNEPPSTIPYETLQTVARWARTPFGIDSLQNHLPPVEVTELTMINLLAGATSSPERVFPPSAPVLEPEEAAAAQLREKRVIAVLANSLLSIGGVGFAAWFAAERLGWKNEWVCFNGLRPLNVSKLLLASSIRLVCCPVNCRRGGHPVSYLGKSQGSSTDPQDSTCGQIQEIG